MADLNTLPATSAARRPRGLLKINGQAFSQCWESWDVDNNTMFTADTFRATLAVSKLPAGFGPDWWAGQAQIDIEIFAGFPLNPASFTAAELTSLFVGRVDDLAWDVFGTQIEISGRDLTAELIDTKTSEKYPNLTSSQIAERLAAAHKLTPVVTATTTKVGTFYKTNLVHLQDERTEWELLTWLAAQEQFIVYVQGRELHFEPKPTGAQGNYVFEAIAPLDANGAWRTNAATIRPSRNLTLAKDIKVVVRSWNAKNKKGFSKTAQATHTRNKVTKGAGSSVAPTQTYTYTVPGLQPDQAQQWANRKLAELSRHEMKLSISGPADNLLTKASTIELRGTGTAFDQTYYPDSVTRSMRLEGGYGWSIEAKNHSVESVVPV